MHMFTARSQRQYIADSQNKILKNRPIQLKQDQFSPIKI